MNVCSSVPFLLYSELEETINAMKQVAVDKVELTRASQDFQSDLDVSQFGLGSY